MGGHDHRALPRAENTASEADLKSIVKPFARDIENWTPTGDIRGTVKTWHSFLLQGAKVAPRINAVDFAKVARSYAPGIDVNKGETWSAQMSHALSFCGTQVNKQKKAPWTQSITEEKKKHKDIVGKQVQDKGKTHFRQASA